MLKKKKNKQRQNRTSGTEAVVKEWELNGFVVFKLGFLQLIWRASLIFKSNLLLALSIILKERELNKPKHVVVECRSCDLETCNPFWYVPQS